MNDLEELAEYRSPFVTRPSANKNSSHYWWSRLRDEYAATGSTDKLDVMLKHVTMDNPPLQSSQDPDGDLVSWPPWQEWIPVITYLLSFFAGLVVMAIAAGVIG